MTTPLLGWPSKFIFVFRSGRETADRHVLITRGIRRNQSVFLAGRSRLNFSKSLPSLSYRFNTMFMQLATGEWSHGIPGRTGERNEVGNAFEYTRSTLVDSSSGRNLTGIRSSRAISSFTALSHETFLWIKIGTFEIFTFQRQRWG